MTNRRNFPKELIKKSGQFGKGNSQMLFNGKVAAIVWEDEKPVYFLTTTLVDAPPTTVQRYDAKEHKKVAVSCPKPVKAYNAFMGGTDKNDQMTRLQRCRRHYKWPRRLVMKFFMWAAYNAYILMGLKKPHDKRLCLQLVGDVRNTSHKGRRRSSDPERRLVDAGSHFPERAPQGTTNHRCVVCQEKYRRAKAANPQAKEDELPKRKKTVYWCSYCEAFLCIRARDSNCWRSWHTKVAYWQ
ncbi:uncharacterized protein LOC121428951 [Lytechinus variegatus]|uniref:uncharacterized protein LOC121428951 n=1 Tax=Lytechinus variegatus TaxID=7654 RepID=UPI001BB0E145|nr:uncharacterized protein LOC121428951 [Lytechinus variegatus]